MKNAGRSTGGQSRESGFAVIGISATWVWHHASNVATPRYGLFITYFCF
jgi:hypothetical protein